MEKTGIAPIEKIPGGKIPIGKIVGLHGIRGMVKVYSYAESLLVFEAGRSLPLRKPNGEEAVYKIISAKPHKRVFLVSLEGITDMNVAERLLDAEFLMDKSELPETEEDTYYWADLIGLSVFAADETYIGKIDSILETGSNDVYVVKNGEHELLVPALESVVLRVDLENGIMKVDLPEGL